MRKGNSLNLAKRVHDIYLFSRLVGLCLFVSAYDSRKDSEVAMILYTCIRTHGRMRTFIGNAVFVRHTAHNFVNRLSDAAIRFGVLAQRSDCCFWCFSSGAFSVEGGSVTTGVITPNDDGRESGVDRKIRQIIDFLLQRLAD